MGKVLDFFAQFRAEFFRIWKPFKHCFTDSIFHKSANFLLIIVQNYSDFRKQMVFFSLIREIFISEKYVMKSLHWHFPNFIDNTLSFDRKLFSCRFSCFTNSKFLILNFSEFLKNYCCISFFFASKQSLNMLVHI